MRRGIPADAKLEVAPPIGLCEVLEEESPPDTRQPRKLLVLAGVRVPDLLFLRVRLDAVDVVRAEPLQRLFVGGDRPLHLVLHDVLVLFLHHAEQLAVVLQLLLAGDE